MESWRPKSALQALNMIAKMAPRGNSLMHLRLRWMLRLYTRSRCCSSSVTSEYWCAIAKAPSEAPSETQHSPAAARFHFPRAVRSLGKYPDEMNGNGPVLSCCGSSYCYCGRDDAAAEVGFFFFSPPPPSAGRIVCSPPCFLTFFSPLSHCFPNV